jgi:hypothetical protein
MVEQDDVAASNPVHGLQGVAIWDKGRFDGALAYCGMQLSCKSSAGINTWSLMLQAQQQRPRHRTRNWHQLNQHHQLGPDTVYYA